MLKKAGRFVKIEWGDYMRNLTIQRGKSYVACLAKLKVYIEDPFINDLTINGTPCRKLGDIKNGETVTFAISDNPGKVYIIADKLSKGYWNEYYNIPAGSEDVYLTGKCYYNPVTGNPFKFDNNSSDADVLAHRKKNKKKGIIIFIICIVLGIISGVIRGLNDVNNDGEPLSGEEVYQQMQESEAKTFTTGKLSVKLNEEFVDGGESDGAVCYESDNVLVYVVEEPMDSLNMTAAESDVDDYIALVIESNELTGKVTPVKDGNITYFEATVYDPELEENCTYLLAVYENGDSFWFVEFFTFESSYDALKPQFIEWAKGVTFAK